MSMSHLDFFLKAPFDGEFISFLTKITILVISLLRVWLPLFESTAQSVALHTSQFLLVSTPFILANGHWLHWLSCSFNITMSPMSNFLLLSFHFCLVCKLCRNSFLHLCQNSSAIYCTHLHLLLECRSGFVKTLGGGMTTFAFRFNKFLGESGIWLLEFGLELIIDFTSVVMVLSVSSFNNVFLAILPRYLLLFKFGIPSYLPYVMLQVGSCTTKSNQYHFFASNSWL